MRRRESFFLPSQERAARSDYVICNDGDIDALKKAVAEIYLLERNGRRGVFSGGIVNCIS
jgi:dephospho-CoA kinase